MKSAKKTRIGCMAALLFFVLVAVFSTIYHKYLKDPVTVPLDVVSWATAVEKCKNRYELQGPPGKIKAPNCRKRTEDEKYYYFSWTSPLAIYRQGADGKIENMSARCQVSKKNAEIVYMDLGKKVLINKLPRK